VNPERIQEFEIRLAAARGLEEIDILNTLAWELVHTDTRRAVEMAQLALSLSQDDVAAQDTYEPGAALSLRTLGYAALIRGDYDHALSMLLEARSTLEYLPGVECQVALGNALCYLGWIYFNYGDLPLAVETLQSALQHAHVISDHRLEAEILNSLGTVYNESYDHRDWEYAVEILQHSLALLEGSRLQGRDELLTHAITHNNLAMAQLRLQDYQNALNNAAEGLALARRLGALDQQIVSLDTTGQIYLAMHEYGQAEAAFRQVLEVYPGIGLNIEEHNLSLARALLCLGRLDEAAQRLQLSLGAVEARGVNRLGYQYHELLSTICEAQSDFPRAISHYKRFSTIKSQIFTEKAQRCLGNLALLRQVETTHRDAESLRLKKLALQQEITASRLTVPGQAEIEINATTDALTGLPNYQHFTLLAGYVFETARLTAQPLAVLALGIHCLGQVDAQAGDRETVEISALIRSCLRDGDLLGRGDSNEFFALLPGYQLPEAQQAALHIIEQTAAYIIQPGSQAIHTALGIGVVQNELAASLETLLEQARQALHAAQHLGGNQIGLYTDRTGDTHHLTRTSP
jgi:diguanylate cyclase (GGDEF)-like protein